MDNFDEPVWMRFIRSYRTYPWGYNNVLLLLTVYVNMFSELANVLGKDLKFAHLSSTLGS